MKCSLGLADCEAFLIGSARLALRASPQAITSVLRLHFSEIHRCPIMLASDARRSFFFDFISALHEEIPSSRSLRVILRGASDLVVGQRFTAWTCYALNRGFLRLEPEYFDQLLLGLISFGQHLLFSAGFAGALARVDVNHLADLAQAFQQTAHR